MAVLGYILSFFMGGILGVLGGGGSIIALPILVYCFNVPAIIATGYSLLIVGIASFIATITYYQKRYLNIKMGIVFAIPSVVGVLIARMILLPSIPDTFSIFNVSITSQSFILLIFSIMILITGLMMFRKKKSSKGKSIVSDLNSVGAMMFIGIEGLVIGVITGIVGAGGGFMIVPALVLITQVSLRQAIAVSLFIVTIKSLSGVIGDIVMGMSYDYRLMILIVSITLLGSFIGSRVNSLINTKILKNGFATLIIIIGVAMFAKEWTRINQPNSIHNSYKSITITLFQDQYKSLESLQLIDVREPQEYEQGSIEGATLIPLGDIKNRLNELNKSNPLVLYCRSGRRSQQAQKILVEHGFKNTINLEGGILAWNNYLKKER